MFSKLVSPSFEYAAKQLELIGHDSVDSEVEEAVHGRPIVNRPYMYG